jgi:hypothetical protein
MIFPARFEERHGPVRDKAGRVTQTHPLEQPFKRGDEKGYFSFGGSAIALFGEVGLGCLVRTVCNTRLME